MDIMILVLDPFRVIKLVMLLTIELSYKDCLNLAFAIDVGYHE